MHDHADPRTALDHDESSGVKLEPTVWGRDPEFKVELLHQATEARGVEVDGVVRLPTRGDTRSLQALGPLWQGNGLREPFVELQWDGIREGHLVEGGWFRTGDGGWI